MKEEKEEEWISAAVQLPRGGRKENPVLRCV